MTTYTSATRVFAQSDFNHPIESLDKSDEDRGSATKADITTHTVKSGETVSEIAESYGLRADTILWTNDISATSPIKEGQVLKILPFDGLLHTTGSGDSLSGLANRYDVSVDDIIELNESALSDDGRLLSGKELLIPRSFAYGSYLLGRGGQDDETGNQVEAVTTQVVATRSGWAHPVPGAVLTQGSHGSNGVDFGAPIGTPVIASDSGTVIKASAGYNGGYGTVVEVDHHDGTTSLYAHLSSTAVSAGAKVKAGQTIGYVGNTGKSTGPHLHFEVTGSGNPFASCGYLTRCGT